MKGQIFKQLAGFIVKSSKDVATIAKGHSPAIFAGTAIVGAAVVAYTTYKCTPKYKAVVEAEERKKVEAGLRATTEEEITKNGLEFEPLKRTEKAKIFVKTMWPMMVALIVTMSSIVASHKISAKRIAALSAAYSVATQKASEAAEKKAEQFIKEKLGQDAADEYKKKVDEEKKNDEKVLASANTTGDILDTDGGTDLFMDYMTGVGFRASTGYIEAKLDYINSHITDELDDFIAYSDVIGEIVPGFPDNGFTLRHGFCISACDGGYPIKVYFKPGILPDGRACHVMHFRNETMSLDG